MEQYFIKHNEFYNSHLLINDLPQRYKIINIFEALISADRKSDWYNFSRIFCLHPDKLSLLLINYMTSHRLNLSTLSKEKRNKLFEI